MKYKKVQPGEWVRPTRKGYKMCCCDCGLVHIIDFRIRKRKIEFRCFRDNRATGQIRRHMKNEPGS